MDAGFSTLQIIAHSYSSYLLYLSYKEINVLLEEVIHLFLKDGLDLSLIVSLRIAGSHGNTPGYQCIALIRDLPGQVTGCLIDLRPLDRTRADWIHVNVCKDKFNDVNRIMVVLDFEGSALTVMPVTWLNSSLSSLQ